jgi:hypothetical protein
MPVQSAQVWIIVCIAAGSGIFCTSIWYMFRKARDRIIELEIRPPQSEAILRPPGHSLTEQLFVLIERQDQKVSSTVLAVLLGSTLLSPSLFMVSQVVSVPALLSDSLVRWMSIGAGFGLLGGALCGYQAFKGSNELLALKREIHARRLGLRGEQAVAEVLHSFEVAGAGYVSFHDVPKEGRGNIDHVVVGPAGVFVIETKTRSQQKPPPKRKRNRLWFDGAKTMFPSGHCEDSAPQAERHAEVMATWIRSFAPDVPVQALLVYPGWEVHLTQRCEGVKAMSANQLRHYFRGLPSTLEPQEAVAIRLMLDKRCRDVNM